MSGSSPAGAPPRVSVVVPAYNAEAYLDECLRSLRGQTLAELEVVVIDDGSTDGTRAVAERHAAEDGRVRVLAQANAGSAAALNRGVREARARWVARLDADDVALPERLERQLAFLEANPDVALLASFGKRIGVKGQELGVFEVGPTTREAFARARAANEPIALLTPSVVFRRDVALALGGFRHSEALCEDTDLWTRFADQHSVLVLPEHLIRYRVHPKSASTTKFFRQMEELMLIRENAARRRAGQPELPLEAHRARLAAQPWPARLARALRWRSQLYYRHAGGMLADRRPSGLLWLLVSFVLWPPFPLQRARYQLPWLRARLNPA